MQAHVQGVRLNHTIFASEEVILSRWGVQSGQKCPCKDGNVAAIMLTTPCRVSGDHPTLTLCPKSSSHWAPHPCLWAGIPHYSQENTPCSLSHLERGCRLYK